ncbi:MAG: hypothetical protein EB100_02140 [Crocinitomicaceae bacterium]|jgi:hypothetical protein|nr:hypothetical protein [Crocinitomicaceae bacterium]
MKNLSLLIIVFLYNAFSFVGAQRDLTLYNLRHVPQSLSTNPSFKPAYKNYISLPLTSGFNIDVINTGFSISDILVPKGPNDSLFINSEDAFFNQMNGSNRLSVNLAFNLFGFGFKLKKNFIFFDIKNKLNAELGYSSDFLKFLIQGNGGSLLGAKADFSGLGFNATNYTEYGLGLNRAFSDKLRIGAKFKLLSGVFNVKTLENNLSITTNKDNYALNIAGGFKVGTSNISQFTDSVGGNPQDLVGNLFNFKNFGLGVDLGATYEVSEKLSVNASVIDLGFIRWSDNVQTHTLKPFDISFKGLESNALFSKDSTDALSNLKDSLSNIFKSTKDNASYSSSLATRFYFGANYKLLPFLNIGAVWYNEINNGSYRPGFSVSTTISSKRLFSTTFNYSYFSGSSNVGFGLNFRGFYIVTDNLLALPMLNLYGSRIASISIGANIVFGSDDEKKSDDK